MAGAALPAHGRFILATSTKSLIMPAWLLFVLIGLLGGFSAGMFGIGGGLVIVPALIYWAKFSQHAATGTSIAILLPPVGLAAAYEYYRHGNVDIQAAIIIAITMFLGSWLGSYLANRLEGPILRLLFAIFVCAVGIYLLFGALRRLGWI